jgi:anthranilate phosphoribosyltransferase
MKKWIEQVASGNELSGGEVDCVAQDLLSEDWDDTDKASFLGALHQRGETPSEITAFAEAFLRLAQPFDVPLTRRPILDVCGTGGDKLGLFNVSTAVMFVAAGAGACVVKHGNRGITSKSGGADVLEALGVRVDLPVAALQEMLAHSGAVFLFAPLFHPAFKAVAGARKILASQGQVSIFNMLGPLLNPARPEFQLTGVFDRQLLDLYARVLPALGRRAAWVVHGHAGPSAVVDEISTLGPTECREVLGTHVNEVEIDAATMGFAPADLDDLRGGDAADNAVMVENILAGTDRGPRREIVLVNAAAALQVTGMARDWTNALQRATESIDSGAARDVLGRMRQVSADA